LSRLQVTVLMPVYNGAAFVREAVDSILAQTLQDFEFLALDDGSTDETLSILDAAASRDERLRVIRGEHRGVIATLNCGLDLARGAYIARMDADDVSHPHRLEKQVDFMDRHPEVGTVGSWVRTIGVSPGWTRQFPTQPEVLRAWLLFAPPIAHPSAMLRKQTLDQNGLRYDPAYLHAEDYAFWIAIAQHSLLGTVPVPLLNYRLRPGPPDPAYRQALLKSLGKIWTGQLERLGLTPHANDLAVHQSISLDEGKASLNDLDQVEAWLLHIREANRQVQEFDSHALDQVLGVRWFALCSQAARLGPRLWPRFWRSPLRPLAQIEPDKLLVFAGKCLAGRVGERYRAAHPGGME